MVPHGTPWVPMGKYFRECRGKSHGVPWDTMRLMVPHEISHEKSSPMGPREFLMGFHGVSWDLMESHGGQADVCD